MKHTKGPWTIDKHPSCDVLYVNIEGGEWPYSEICTIYPGFIEDHRANARLIADAPWMRREIERVGRALFTGTKTGYVGTEEDLRAIGQFVEGVCKTNERLMDVEAKNFAARAIMQKFVDKVDRGMARSIETYAEMKQWMEDE